MIPCSAQTHSVGSLALAGLAALGGGDGVQYPPP